MNLQKLTSILSKQEKNLKSLIEIGQEKKETLVNNDYEKLNEIIGHEENALLSIQLTEEDRLKIMKELFEKYNIDNERYKLEILVKNLKKRVDPQIIKNISDFEKRIKTYIEDINKINHLNMVLIQQSRSLINETVQAVLNSSTKKILDRKG